MTGLRRTEGCVNCGGPASPSRGDRAYDASIPDRVRALALDIAHRLRPVCANMPDDEMMSFATSMATVELDHFERAAPRVPHRRRATG
jgi:hypothetical protein